MRDAVTADSAIRMIVNADDFGYFDEVSRGILHCAEAGVVTATGVMANGPAFEKWVGRLHALPAVSVGVHLNATLGRPLTAEMRAELPSPRKEFPSKGALAAMLLRGRVAVSTVIHEWRAQIEHCARAGLKLRFLNSHEHIHVFPSLFRAVLGLANEFGISHVRSPRPEWGPSWSAAGVFRSAVFAAVRPMAPRQRLPIPALIGLSNSGRLDMRYFRWRFAKLQRHRTYELMCHPGWKDAVALQTPKLAAYHDWELELRTLTSPEFAELLRTSDIALVSYSEPSLNVASGSR